MPQQESTLTVDEQSHWMQDQVRYDGFAVMSMLSQRDRSDAFSTEQKHDVETIAEHCLVLRLPRSELVRMIDDYCALPANTEAAEALKHYILRG